jgi:hypothetical protein
VVINVGRLWSDGDVLGAVHPRGLLRAGWWQLQQIGSTTSFSTVDDGSAFGRRHRYSFTWTPGTTVPLGLQTIYAVGVNAAGDGLVTQANTNITTTNP